MKNKPFGYNCMTNLKITLQLYAVFGKTQHSAPTVCKTAGSQNNETSAGLFLGAHAQCGPVNFASYGALGYKQQTLNASNLKNITRRAARGELPELHTAQ